jgi:hypothetical protein
MGGRCPSCVFPVLAVLAAGCSAILGFHDGLPSDGREGAPCTAPGSSSSVMGTFAPCQSNLFCFDSACRQSCARDDGCPPGERCVGLLSPSQNAMGCAASLPCDPGCVVQHTCACPAGDTCGSDGQCRTPCEAKTGTGCAPDQVCVAPPTCTGCPGACFGTNPSHDPGSPLEAGPPTDGPPPPPGDGPPPDTVLVSGVASPRGLAVDGSTVYFTSGSTISYCSIVGCGGMARSLVATDANSGPLVLTPASPARLAWSTLTTPGFLYACPTSGCTSATGFAPTTFANPSHLAASGSSVLVTTDDDHVYKCDASLGTCNATPFYTGSGGRTVGIAADDTNAYFAEVGVAMPNIRRCPLATGCQNVATELLVNTGITPYEVAVDGGNIYFTDGQGHLVYCSKSSCPSPGPIVTRPSIDAITLGSLASAYVYFLSSTTGEVARCPKPPDPQACQMSRKTYATGAAGPHALVADMSNLYWTNTNEGTVHKVVQ